MIWADKLALALTGLIGLLLVWGEPNLATDAYSLVGAVLIFLFFWVFLRFGDWITGGPARRRTGRKQYIALAVLPLIVATAASTIFVTLQLNTQFELLSGSL